MKPRAKRTAQSLKGPLSELRLLKSIPGTYIKRSSMVVFVSNPRAERGKTGGPRYLLVSLAYLVSGQ